MEVPKLLALTREQRAYRSLQHTHGLRVSSSMIRLKTCVYIYLGGYVQRAIGSLRAATVGILNIDDDSVLVYCSFRRAAVIGGLFLCLPFSYSD